MIRSIQKVIFIAVLFFVFLPVQADDSLTVNFFYGTTCPHCAKVEPFIHSLEPKYPEINFKEYEVYENRDNSLKLNTWFESYGVPANRRGVPVVFVNGSYLIGDTPIINNLEDEIKRMITENGKAEPVVKDVVPPKAGEERAAIDPVVAKPAVPVRTTEQPAEPAMPMPLAEPVAEEAPSEFAEEPVFEALTDDASEKEGISESVVTIEKEVSRKVTEIAQGKYWLLPFLAVFIICYLIYKIWIAKSICVCLTEKQKDYIIVGIAVIALIAFFIMAKNISPDLVEQIGYSLPLPVFTFFIALVDGFNPCNLFVLTFLLALLVSASHSKARIYAVGFSFVFMIFVIYFLFMAAWLNIFKFIGFITPLRIGIAMIALIAGLINCKELLFFRKGITLMVQEAHKGPLVRRIEHMKEVIKKGTMPVLISSSIALAAFASLVELPCTAGFPIIYTGILSAKSFEGFSYYGYLAFYNLIYVLPLAVLITIFGYTFQGKKVSQRQMQIIKFIGGLIMILLGIILLVNPGMIGIAG